MSQIFEKNINALKNKNSILAQKLLEHDLTETPLLVRENNFYNFKYKGKYLHNPLNPLAESVEIFSMCENSPVTIHLIYGIGLGYLFQVVSAKSVGAVILYEPDLNILKSAFSVVDFSNDILKNNVFISDDFNQICEYIYQKSNVNNTPLLISTMEYRELDEEKFNKLANDLQQEIGRYSLDLKYTKEKFYSLVLKIIDNIPKLMNEIPVIELKDRCKGKTAVVVSAGPTLDRNIEIIKKYRENVVLIVVGTAMKALAKHGILPDFLCIIEANDCSKQIRGLDEILKDVNFVTEPFSNPKLREFEFKNTFTHISQNLPVNSFWADLTGIDIGEYYSKGTVSYTALNVARILGCTKIVLVGQDLAYIEGQCYSKDSAYKDLECAYNKELKKWEITAKDFENFCNSLGNQDDYETRKQIAIDRIQALNNALYYVKGINGDMIPTESVYAAFIQPLSEFTKIYSGIEYINTSLVGAQIDGYKNISLEEALKGTDINYSKDFSVDFKYDRELIKDNLFKMKESIQPALFIIEELKKIGKNLNNDLNRYKNVTQEILKNLKRLSVGYTALSYDFSKKNELFEYLTVSERIDLDYEMKIMREFSVESVTNIVQKILAYCLKAEERIKEISNEIDKVMGEI